MQVQHEQAGCCGSINGKQLPRGNTRKRQIWSSSSLEIQRNSMNAWSHKCIYPSMCVCGSNGNIACKSNEKLLPCWCCDKPNCLQLQANTLAAPSTHHTLTPDRPFSACYIQRLVICRCLAFNSDSYSHMCAFSALSGRGAVELLVIKVTNITTNVG